MGDAWLCIACQKPAGQEVIRIEQSVFVNHNTHGERFVTYTVVACSWSCVEEHAAACAAPSRVASTPEEAR